MIAMLKDLRKFQDFEIISTVADKRVVGANRRLESYDRVVRVCADGRIWARGSWIDKAQGIDGYFYAT